MNVYLFWTGGGPVVSRKNIYISIFTASAAIFLLGFINCSRGESQVFTGFSNLGSSGCKVDPDVLVKQINDGDYHAKIYAPESVAHNASQKLYLDDQNDPTTAPKWKANVINWYYNPANEPSSMSPTALATIQSSMGYWTSVCNIKFNYKGLSNAIPNDVDGTNVIGWGDAGGATGITYTYMRWGSPNVDLYEADMEFNVADIGDSQSLKGVANHELGHMLGLAHSDVSASIMFANPYHSVSYLLMLREDDIAGCVDLYGAATAPTPTPTPTPAPAATATPSPSKTPGSPGTGQGC
jgi:hypothetical protein